MHRFLFGIEGSDIPLGASVSLFMVPILAVAEADNNARLVRGLEIGVNDYLIRPTDKNEMLARVRTQIKKKRYSERLRDSGRVAVVPVPGLNVYYLGFDTDRPPFNDRRVRRAVVQGVNVPRIVLFLGRGTAVVAKGPLAPSMKAYDPSVGQPSYAPEAAKELLAKAGYRSGLTITLLYPQGITLWSEIATGIQHDLRRIGIDVELLGKATFAEVSRALPDREGMMFVYSWHVRAPYPERLLIPLFHSHSIGSTNFTRYGNPVVDRLLESALRLPEGPEQRRLYAQAQRQIVDDAPMLFLYHGTRMAAVGERVRGLALNLSAAPHDKLVTVDLHP